MRPMYVTEEKATECKISSISATILQMLETLKNLCYRSLIKWSTAANTSSGNDSTSDGGEAAYSDEEEGAIK